MFKTPEKRATYLGCAPKTRSERTKWQWGLKKSVCTVQGDSKNVHSHARSNPQDAKHTDTTEIKCDSRRQHQQDQPPPAAPAATAPTTPTTPTATTTSLHPQIRT